MTNDGAWGFSGEQIPAHQPIPPKALADMQRREAEAERKAQPITADQGARMLGFDSAADVLGRFPEHLHEHVEVTLSNRPFIDQVRAATEGTDRSPLAPDALLARISNQAHSHLDIQLSSQAVTAANAASHYDQILDRIEPSCRPRDVPVLGTRRVSELGRLALIAALAERIPPEAMDRARAHVAAALGPVAPPARSKRRAG